VKKTNTWLGMMTLGAAAVLTTGCGGGHRIAEITPAHEQRLTGHWVLDEKESGSPDSLFRRPRGGRGGARGGDGDGGGAPPGGGEGRGGFGGRGGGMGGMGGRGGFGGGMGGRGGMGGAPRARSGQMNPAAMQATRRLVMAHEEALDIVLTDSAATVTYPGEEPWVMLFGETVERKVSDDVTIKAKAEWDDERLVVTRSVSGGGSLKETFEPALDARRLVVDVEPSFGGGGPRGGSEFQRVYGPAPPTSGDR
jgi:hypothetical protein